MGVLIQYESSELNALQRRKSISFPFGGFDLSSTPSTIYIRTIRLRAKSLNWASARQAKMMTSRRNSVHSQPNSRDLIAMNAARYRGGSSRFELLIYEHMKRYPNRSRTSMRKTYPRLGADRSFRAKSRLTNARVLRAMSEGKITLEEAERVSRLLNDAIPVLRAYVLR
jgi:hypothetical protein